MAKKKNAKQDALQIQEKSDNAFDETVDVIEDDVESSDTDDTTDQYAEILLDPTKAVKMLPDNQEENEEVLYCRNCGVKRLFIDNICMVCGLKKSKKAMSNSSEDGDEEELDFPDDSSQSLEEY